MAFSFEPFLAISAVLCSALHPETASGRILPRNAEGHLQGHVGPNQGLRRRDATYAEILSKALWVAKF